MHLISYTVSDTMVIISAFNCTTVEGKTLQVYPRKIATLVTFCVHLRHPFPKVVFAKISISLQPTQVTDHHALCALCYTTFSPHRINIVREK